MDENRKSTIRTKRASQTKKRVITKSKKQSTKTKCAPRWVRRKYEEETILMQPMNTLKIVVRTPPGQAEKSEAKLRRDVFSYTKSEIRTKIVSDTLFEWYWKPKDYREQERVVKALGKAEGRIKGSFRIIIPILKRAVSVKKKAGWTAHKLRSFIEARWRKLYGNTQMPDGFSFDPDKDSGELEGLDELNAFLKEDMFSIEVLEDEQ